MNTFLLPKHKKTEEGKTRRVGYELEYSGPDLEQSVKLLQEIVGGDVKEENAYCFSIHNKQLGKFGVEIDAALLKEGYYKEYLSEIGVEINDLDFSDKLDNVLEKLAATVVPNEIVTPPIPVTDMEIVEDIVTALRKENAEGTHASVFYAFGLHINPELASTSSEYLLNHIRAFTLLYDWICKKSHVDLSRRMAPYIKPYPDDYQKHILHKDYQPDIDTLINDYLDLVGSRNHALDMLPAFAHINEKTVMQNAKEKELIKPRPAFHYRLANSLVDEADWAVADEWNVWFQVEELANNQKLLTELSSAYIKYLDGSILPAKGKWVDHIDDAIK